MEFDWDAQKAAGNIEKHGIAFDIVFDLDWSAAVIRPVLADFGEPRWTSLHRMGDQQIFVVFTRRGGVFRIISIRRGHEKEFRKWLR